MEWKFTVSGGPSVVIAISSGIDVTQRLDEYRKGRGIVPSDKQSTAEIYAEATYLKYQSANEKFGATVGTLDDLKDRLSKKAGETLLLLEGVRQDSHQLIGALLLRFAWTGDTVIDFVGTNLAATVFGTPPLANSGAMLVYAAVRLGAVCGAPNVFAETAQHSVGWWNNMLAAGEDLIKVSTIQDATERLTQIITKQGNATIEET